VTEARALEKWAHGLIQEEVAKGGGVARDGDEPNAYSNNQSPKALLARARTALPAEVGLLETVYGGRATEAEITRLAEPLGGGPIGVLTARYRLKRWLRDHAGAPFAVTPEQPILDRAPLPLYESSQMANESEMVQFEQWMLTDLDLCRDIAEFATFSVALRGGIGKAAPAPAPRPTATSGGPARPAAASGTRSSSVEPAARGGVSKALVALVVLGILAIVLVTTAVVAVRFLL
jgi:hypothetical protein